MKKLLVFLLWASLALAQTNSARMLSGVNYQTGTAYTFVGADITRPTVFNNSSPVTATLTRGTTTNGFGKGSIFTVVNAGAGLLSITCTGCTINSQPILTLTQNQGADIYGDGVNFAANIGGGTGGGGGGNSVVTNPSSTQTIVGQPLNLVNAALNVCTIGGVQYVGSGSPYTVCWGASDIGAQINAAYAALPSAGGKIVVTPKSDGTCYSYSTPIVFSSLAKYPLLEYAGSNGTAKGCLNFTPTSGAAITLDYATPAAPPGASAHGLRNISLINNACQSFGGCGGTAIGVEVGLTNNGDSEGYYDNVAIQGFNIGYRNLGNNFHFGVVFNNPQFSYNAIAVQLNSPTPVQFHFGTYFSNVFVFTLFASNSSANVLADYMDVFNNTVFFDATTSTTGASDFECKGCHFEAASVAQGLFFSGNIGVLLNGGVMEVDTAGGTLPAFMNVSGRSVYVQGVYFASGATVTNLLIANSPVEGTLDGFVISNTQIPGPYVSGANSGKIDTHLVTIGSATPLPTFFRSLSTNLLTFPGSTSGSATLSAAAVAGTFNIQWPTNNGANGNCFITDGATPVAHTSWGTCPGGGGGGNIASLAGDSASVQTLSTQNDTNITLSWSNVSPDHKITAGFTGTLAAARLNANTPQSCSAPGTPLICGISTQNLSIGIGVGSTWGATALNANVVQGIGTADANIGLSILNQVLTANWTSTLGVTRGGLNLAAIAANQIPVGTAANVYTATTLPSCSATNATLQFNTTTHAFGCPVLSFITNPMTTLGDIIYSSDGSGTPARLAGPTSPDGVAYSLISTSASGAATAPAWGLSGVAGRSVSGASDNVVATDRANWITYTGSSATAIALPSAASFGSNFVFGVTVTGTVGGTGATVTATTSKFQPENSSTFVILQGENCTITSYDNVDYFHRCGPGQLIAGTNLTFTRSQFGITINGDGNAVSSASTLTANALILGNATKSVTPMGSLGTTTTLLHGNAAGAPTFAAVSLVNDVTGNLALTHLCSGTGADATTFLRGDCSWAVPAGGGTFNGPGSAVADNLLSFNGTSGGVGKDSGIASANVSTAASAAGAANQVALSNAADKTLKYAAADSTTTHAFFATAGAPAFRAIVAGDIPTLNQNTSGTAANLSGTPALPNGVTATTQAAKDNSTKLATTEYVDRPTPLTAGTSVTLSAPRQYFVCTSTCTITVPVPAAGYEFCVMNDDNINTVITLSAIGSSARYENTARSAYGTAGTGTFVSGGAVGDKVCLLGRDSTHYLTASFTGTWTAN